MNKDDEARAIKKAEKAKRKRVQRKTPYPFGFEYRSDRKWVYMIMIQIKWLNMPIFKI